MNDNMKYKGFIGSVHFAAEDRAFYGKVEGVNDLITFEGSTVDEHIKDCNKNDTPVEKSYKGNLNIRLSPELHKKVAYNATIRGLSLNQYINIAIKKEIASSDPD